MTGQSEGSSGLETLVGSYINGIKGAPGEQPVACFHLSAPNTLKRDPYFELAKGGSLGEAQNRRVLLYVACRIPGLVLN